MTTGKNFRQELAWMMRAADGNVNDVAVCLSSSENLGFNYEELSYDITILVGDNDELASIRSVEWLAEQLPSAKLTILQGGTHSGALFMLSPKIVESLGILA